jgi:hypothetical protein
MKILEYDIQRTGQTQLEIPVGAKILSLVSCKGCIKICLLGDDAAPRKTRKFDTYLSNEFVATIDSGIPAKVDPRVNLAVTPQFIGTVVAQVPIESFQVIHIFEITPPKQ